MLSAYKFSLISSVNFNNKERTIMIDVGFVDEYGECLKEIDKQIYLCGPIEPLPGFNNFAYIRGLREINDLKAKKMAKIIEFQEKCKVLREIQIATIEKFDNEMREALQTAFYNEEGYRWQCKALGREPQTHNEIYELIIREKPDIIDFYKQKLNIFNYLYRASSEFASSRDATPHSIDHQYNGLKKRLDQAISQPLILNEDDKNNMIRSIKIITGAMSGASSLSENFSDLSSDEKTKPPSEEKTRATSDEKGENMSSQDNINSGVGASEQSRVDEGAEGEQLQSVIIHARADQLEQENEPVAQHELVPEPENILQQKVEDANPQKDEAAKLLKAQLEYANSRIEDLMRREAEFVRREAEKDAQIARLTEIINLQAEGKVNSPEIDAIIGDEFPPSQDGQENQDTPLAGSGLD